MLRQILGDNKGNAMEFGEDQDMLSEKLKVLQHSYNE